MIGKESNKMLTMIRKYLSPPVFPGDEEKTRTASLLNAILLIVILMVFLFSLLDIALFHAISRLWIELLLVVITLMSLALMRRGQVRLASVIFSVTLLVIVSAGTFMVGGFRGSTMGAFIGTVIIAGILLGNWTALWYGVIAIVFAGWIVYADFHHMLPPVSDGVALLTQWGEFSSVLIGIVGLLALVITNLEQTLERVKRKEKELSFKLVESQQLTIWAQEASEFKSMLLARVSHELRTPLGVVMGMAEMLQHEVHGPLSAEQKKIIERIQVNARYLETTFTELLEQSQLDKEMLQMQATDFSLANVLARVTPDFREQAEQKGLRFDERIAPELPATLQGIPTHIEQILFYLLDNAIKFTQQGSVEVDIFKADDGHWSIRVRDTGIGISAEQQELIFEPFRQVDESISREYGGLGLGLSIVKRLISVMKGTVLVESEPGKGSAFTVTLPLVESTLDGLNEQVQSGRNI